jgi:hypothetical protein
MQQRSRQPAEILGPCHHVHDLTLMPQGAHGAPDGGLVLVGPASSNDDDAQENPPGWATGTSLSARER